MNSRRSIALIVVILFVGAIIGTLVGDLIAHVLPEGVVRQFFLQSAEFSLGGLAGSENDAISLDLGVFALIFGLRIKLSFAALLGLAAAYYFLRYFR
ncbi:MAG: DUF4321 domain-containing protein [Candidatus Neomarinimicrobiota bacterium]